MREESRISVGANKSQVNSLTKGVKIVILKYMETESTTLAPTLVFTSMPRKAIVSNSSKDTVVYYVPEIINQGLCKSLSRILLTFTQKSQRIKHLFKLIAKYLRWFGTEMTTFITHQTQTRLLRTWCWTLQYQCDRLLGRIRCTRHAAIHHPKSTSRPFWACRVP